MEEAYDEPPAPDYFSQGRYVTIPEGFPHCYVPYRYMPGSPITGIGRSRRNVPEMNSFILERVHQLWDGSYNKHDYLLVEDEDEKQMLVRVDNYLLEVNRNTET